MEKTEGSRSKKRKPDSVTKESSSSKLPKNDNQINKRTDDPSVIFSHFPEEIWLMITDKVVDSDSLTNLMQASPVFRNLLLPRRVEFLFPQVWKVLGVKFEKREEEVYSYDFEGYAPWRSKILKIRMVCKSWCRGVDEFYENLPDSNHYRMSADREGEHISNYYSSGIRRFEWFNIFNCLDSRERIEEFIEHFETTHFKTGKQRNPLIGRHVRICRTSEGHENEIFSLLSKYGQHFWFCDIRLSDQLKELLELMPNLKTLRVALKQKQEMASQPLPKLHKLDFLSLENFPSFLSNALISANNHVSMLEIRRNAVQEGNEFYKFPMPNLKQLSIEYFSKRESENLYQSEVNWPLEKLNINLRTCLYMPWSQIFTLLETKWATTLKNVAIYFPPPVEFPSDTNNVSLIIDGSSTKLNLPNVQRFKLTSRQIFSLDFILPMKSLELLEITVDEITINEATEKVLRLIEQKQVVQFVGYFQRFTESNIWNLFPNLKKIQFVNESNFGLYTYNREECGGKQKTCSARNPIRHTPKDNLWLIKPSLRQVAHHF